MANPEAKTELFPTIGQVVDKTDQLQETEPKNGKDEAVALNAEDEDRPVTEIESLCMNCEQQVRLASCFNTCDIMLSYNFGAFLGDHSYRAQRDYF